ncbi:MAG: hypothetical protein IJM18_07230, partial [Clostridia bacterium]|nr:hypothetical protein [Clostridia bacterium]
MNKNATESNLRIENEERFNKIFAKDVDGDPSPAYTNYIEGAKKVWRIYSDKYRLWTRGSLEGKPVNTQKGKNRGVEIYDGDVHLVGFS